MRLGRLGLVAAAALGIAVAAAPQAGARAQFGMTFLDNGAIRLGVDLFDGGKITYLAHPRGDENGDASNLLFQLEPSFYSGPFEGFAPGWHAFEDAAEVVAHSNDGETIYTKTAPSCECVLETWTTLDRATVHVRHRLTSFRSDATQYASWQELPALYTSGRAYHLFSYTGAAPFTGGAVRELTEGAGGFFVPGPNFAATEHWAALVDDDGFGVGIVAPDLTRFAGTPGTAEQAEYPFGVNGYLSPSTREVLDGNAVYDYSYTLVVGSVDAIRAYASAHRPDPRPDYRFHSGRRHWSYENASDRGTPIDGALRVSVDEADPQLVGPEQWWHARTVRRIYVRGAWHTAQSLAELFWSVPDGGFSAARRMPFLVRRDGRFHTYALALAHLPSYGGTIDRLRLDPVGGRDAGWVDVACISWKPCRPDRAAEGRLARAGRFVPYLEAFEHRLDGRFWAAGGAVGTGTSLAAADGRVELALAADAANDSRGFIARSVTFRCTLSGDFDARVAYTLLDWPDANGVHVNFTAGDRTILRRDDGYSVYFPPQTSDGFQAQPDAAGELRLVRRAGIAEAYFRRLDGWVPLRRESFSRGALVVALGVSTNDAEFGHRKVRVAFDNFRVVGGRLECPSTSG